MSASALYGVIQTCSTGFLAMCGCRDMSNEGDPKPGWSWGGCSDDLDNSKYIKIAVLSLTLDTHIILL